ncbi:phosphatidate cytidylyltransferase [Microbacterium sp. zg.Y1090]|uniref:phosphatidate cytidylyltransferase n=1 Tax=Microbacterium TaxID=33882 RepID=UPI00214C4DA7|nr:MULTISPECIES: phosphatidate cytidylyltransferase [unclassified Microbacterium]MCR2811652.1 phosphatidate cytidylyltransferase [Microbacterium sp. zg.Y1084]MCR2818910.1 phosphatidate cytidylyltransferase [Microbacterium sp. zg.Y1090]MDL5487001.1 phosphatidate cytidylyltransferase [Microbacterium sp. zg-Y1211]WIM27218.1 phosphatidate cytidylyltransferase [Microbacterium sp. zg-Y1090]
MTDPSDDAERPLDPPVRRSDGRRTPGDPGVEFSTHLRAARSEFEHQVERARADFDLANEKIKQRTGRDLIVATLIGLALGVVVIGSLMFFKQLFLVFAIPVALLGVFEFSRALQSAGRRVDVVPQLIAALALVLSGYFLDYFTHWAVAFAAVAFVIVWRLVAQMAANDGRTYGDVLSDTLISGFVQLYVAFLGSLLLILLRQDQGEWWVLAMIGTAVAADTGAYAFGLMLGKHPMAPRISPKKTWEGFGGAVLAAVAAGVLFGIFLLQVPWWAGVVIGLAVLATATLGDLGESMIKRDLGIKDMSSWLPGHGGVLDRLDSILPSTVPALALYFVFFPLVAA